MIPYLLDLLGVAVFAVSGALVAGHSGLDLLGIIVIATVTAIGGETLRDLLMKRHPIFWVEKPTYLIVIIFSALMTILYCHFLPFPYQVLLWADALGLAFFSLSGAEIAAKAKLSPLIVILMGCMTGTAGGLLRDVLCNQVPLILQRDLYATAAIGGIVVYLLLQFFRLKKILRFCRWHYHGATAALFRHLLGSPSSPIPVLIPFRSNVPIPATLRLRSRNQVFHKKPK